MPKGEGERKMFKVTILGFKPVNYVRKKDGKQITGAELHFCRAPLPIEKDFSGLVTDTLYVSDNNELYSRISAQLVNKEVELVYTYDGRFNHLTGINVVKSASTTA